MREGPCTPLRLPPGNGIGTLPLAFENVKIVRPFADLRNYRQELDVF